MSDQHTTTPAETEDATIIDLAAITEAQWAAGRAKFVELAAAHAGYKRQAADDVSDAAPMAILQAMAHVAPLHGRRLGPIMTLSRDLSAEEAAALGVVAALLRTHRPKTDTAGAETLPAILGAFTDATLDRYATRAGFGNAFKVDTIGRVRNRILDLAAGAILVAARIDTIEGSQFSRPRLAGPQGG